MRTLLFTCVALAGSTAAFAAPPAADWLTKPATFSNADVVNARGASMAPAVLGVVPETLGAQSVIVTLVDKQGLTQVEIVCSPAAIYELQNGSEFTRRSSLGTLHAAVVGALVGKPAGDAPAKKGGAFGRIELPASAGEKLVSEFVKSREATDVVVTLGWNAKEGPSVYGTLYSDRIELNPDAPKAAKK
jgi:hypothetical protein